jgi:molecular chaperone HscB
MDGQETTVEEQKAHGAGVIACWSCKGPVALVVAFCETCGAVQPPGQANHFLRLGLERSFDVDVEGLDKHYFDMQRHLHPDRFATRSAQEKSLSQQQATAINDAYETLKEPLKRADYLVELLSVDVLPEGCNLVNDQALLMETMELREALVECETAEQIDVLSIRAQNDIKGCIEKLSKLFKDDDIEGACRLKTRLRYLKKLTEEIRIHQMKLI